MVVRHFIKTAFATCHISRLISTYCIFVIFFIQTIPIGSIDLDDDIHLWNKVESFVDNKNNDRSILPQQIKGQKDFGTRTPHTLLENKALPKSDANMLVKEKPLSGSPKPTVQTYKTIRVPTNDNNYKLSNDEYDKNGMDRIKYTTTVQTITPKKRRRVKKVLLTELHQNHQNELVKTLRRMPNSMFVNPNAIKTVAIIKETKKNSNFSDFDKEKLLEMNNLLSKNKQSTTNFQDTKETILIPSEPISDDMVPQIIEDKVDTSNQMPQKSFEPNEFKNLPDVLSKLDLSGSNQDANDKSENNIFDVMNLNPITAPNDAAGIKQFFDLPISNKGSRDFSLLPRNKMDLNLLNYLKENPSNQFWKPSPFKYNMESSPNVNQFTEPLSPYFKIKPTNNKMDTDNFMERISMNKMLMPLGFVPFLSRGNPNYLSNSQYKPKMMLDYTAQEQPHQQQFNQDPSQTNKFLQPLMPIFETSNFNWEGISSGNNIIPEPVIKPHIGILRYLTKMIVLAKNKNKRKTIKNIITFAPNKDDDSPLNFQGKGDDGSEIKSKFWLTRPSDAALLQQNKFYDPNQDDEPRFYNNQPISQNDLNLRSILLDDLKINPSLIEETKNSYGKNFAKRSILIKLLNMILKELEKVNEMGENNFDENIMKKEFSKPSEFKSQTEQRSFDLLNSNKNPYGLDASVPNSEFEENLINSLNTPYRQSYSNSRALKTDWASRNFRRIKVQMAPLDSRSIMVKDAAMQTSDREFNNKLPPFYINY